MRADIVVTVSLRPEPGGFVLAGAASWRGRRPTWSVAPNTQQTQTAENPGPGRPNSLPDPRCRARVVGSKAINATRVASNFDHIALCGNLGRKVADHELLYSPQEMLSFANPRNRLITGPFIS